MGKIDIANIASQLNELKLTRFVFKARKTKSSDKFDTSTSERLQLLTATAVLSLCHQIKVKDCDPSYVTDKMEMNKYIGYLFQEWSIDAEQTAIDEMEGYIVKERSYIECGSSDYFTKSVSRIVRDSTSASHARAFGVQNKPVPPNFVLRFKGFSNDGLQIRIGIKYELIPGDNENIEPGTDIFKHNGKVKIIIVDIIRKQK